MHKSLLVGILLIRSDGMRNICVSVVVPVFNAEKFLIECLESLVNQTLKNIEIILVDDGSTDESISIIERFKEHDQRIRLYKQSNLHAGVARNNGLSHATGEYVIFLDADDFFEPGMLKSAYSIAKKTNADIVQFGFWYFDNKAKKNRPEIINGKRGLHKVTEYGDKIFTYTAPVPWNKLIKRNLIIESGIRYQDLLNGNDEYFNRAICLAAKDIYSIKKRFVHYRINNDSSLRGQLRNKKADPVCGFKICSELKSYMVSHNIFEGDFKEAYFKYAQSIILSRVQLSACSIDYAKMANEYFMNRLVPDIFESEKEFANNKLIYELYGCNNVEDYLCTLAFYASSNNQLQNSLEYRIGSKILFAIRLVWQYFK